MDAVTASIRSAWITDEAGNSARFSSASAAGMSESRATLVRFLGCKSSIALDLQWRPTMTAPYLAHARILGKDVYPPKHVMDATRERASTGW